MLITADVSKFQEKIKIKDVANFIKTRFFLKTRLPDCELCGNFSEISSLMQYITF